MKETSHQNNTPKFLVVYRILSRYLTRLVLSGEPASTHTAHAVRASAQLLPLIDQLLVQHECELSDLDFIALDQGPGAFTSLRVVLTTINGIAFAQKFRWLVVTD